MYSRSNPRKNRSKKEGRIAEALLQEFIEKYMLNINSKFLIITDLSRNLSEDVRKNVKSCFHLQPCEKIHTG